MEIEFKLNGQIFIVSGATIPLNITLNNFIRTYANLPGTKFMCLEGSCGACIVTIKESVVDTDDVKIYAANSCLKPVLTCNDSEITTIEAVGNKFIGYNPIQTRIWNLNGTQCGYCTPGMVMNMYSLLEGSNGNLTMASIEKSFDGNLCRCTGYRSILEAFKSFAADAIDKIDYKCMDIEDLPKSCSTTGSLCARSCKKFRKEPILVMKDTTQWYAVFNIKSLFEIFDKIGDTAYTLVAGYTGVAIYYPNPNIEVYIDINGISELISYEIGKELVVGANISLNQAIEIFTSAAKHTGFEYCKHLAKHISLVANVPIRNVATIAGNLSLKHDNIDFVSDIFTILDAVGANLTIAESNSSQTVMSLAEYINYPMTNKIILSFSLPKLSKSKYKLRTNKIMQRAQGVSAVIIAAFLFEFEVGVVVSAKICFGGISPKFMHASNTENILVGQNLYTDDMLQTALNFLANELRPDWVLPALSPDYRKNLALSLFYKFVLNTAPPNLVKQEYVSGANVLHRPTSSGTQSYISYENNYPLTQPIPRYEGLLQTSGEAIYANDIPTQPNELWAAYVVAKKVNYQIAAIDPSAALQTPGVFAFYSAKHIPGQNSFTPLYQNDEEIFIGINSNVLYYGQPVGIILANSYNTAIFTSSQVNITYFSNVSSTKPIVPTIQSTSKIETPERFRELTISSKTKTIDICSNLKKMYNKVNNIKVPPPITTKGRFILNGQYDFALEPQTTVCVPAEDGITVYSSTQWIDLTNVAISGCLNMPENKINLIVRRTGGGFGGRISRSAQTACACALACFISNRPVRFVLPIETIMTTTGKRYPVINEYSVQTDENGKISSLTNWFAEDFGCSLNESVLSIAKSAFQNGYNSNTWKMMTEAATTDAPSNTYCSAPGFLEGIAMIENIMEHIAFVTGKDPISVRLANIPQKSKMRNMMSDFLQSIDFTSRKTDIDTFNTKNRWQKRGIAIVPINYQITYIGPYPAFVAICHIDGSVIVEHGGIEMGQGINTKVVQVVAYTLGIPYELISIKPTTNVIGQNAAKTTQCQAVDSILYAVWKASQVLAKNIKSTRESMTNSSWSEIIQKCFLKHIKLTAKYTCESGDIDIYNIMGLSCAEVEVDILTGNIILKRVDILQDAGKSINPAVDIIQIEGAFVMGLGYWLTERLVYDQTTGQLVTDRTWTYYPPGANDIPVDFRINLLRDGTNPYGVLDSKASGEPAICMSIVAIFAMRYALTSARNDAGLPPSWIELGAPSTIADTFMNAGNSLNDYKLST